MFEIKEYVDYDLKKELFKIAEQNDKKKKDKKKRALNAKKKENK